MTHDCAVQKVDLGWQATCSCGWIGLTWSVPGRNHAKASVAMAHTDHDMHVREAIQ